MRRLTFILGTIGVLVFAYCPMVLAGDWHPGILHAHSRFSDGIRMPGELISRAKKADAHFLIVTDHYEQIDGLYLFNNGKPKWGAFYFYLLYSASPGILPIPFELWAKLNFQDYGFDRYRASFFQESTNFVVIPGAEITTYWGKGVRAASHTLALGVIFKDDKDEESLYNLQLKEGTQQRVINRLNKLGLLSVAAHPSFVAPKPFPWEWPEILDYQFYPGQINGLGGIEIFNDHDQRQYIRTRNWYLTLLGQRRDIFVTSGCDSHAPVDPIVADEKRWQRKTWVYCEKLSQKAILKAIAQGHTYAANWGASFEALNHIPGFKIQEVEKAKFFFKVRFENKVKSDKIVRIYRDGTLVPESEQKISESNINSYQPPGFFYDWEDEGARGEHCYVIEVEGVLITSPIKLKVRDSLHIVTEIEIPGKYFYQEKSGEWFLELKRDGTAIWIGYDRCGLPPEDIYWRLTTSRKAVELYSRSRPRWKREFLIKGKGILVRRLNASAWTKKGIKYSFSPDEVIGTYRFKRGKVVMGNIPADGEVITEFTPGTPPSEPQWLELRPDGTCTLIARWVIDAIAYGKWEIRDNLITLNFPRRAWGDEVHRFRVLDRNTLIWEHEMGYVDWVRQNKEPKNPTPEKEE